MRALVTGGRGFVGRWLVRRLREQGDEVVEVDRADADVRDAAAMTAVVRAARPDAIFHLAAQASVARSFKDPVETYATNVTGVVAALEAARAAAPDAAFVFASSAEVYGAVGPGDLPLTEDRPLRPATPYAASKAAAEIVLAQYFRSYGLRTVSVRSFNLIGPGQSEDFALPSFARQLARIRRDGAPPVLRVGNLSAERDMTDVRDAVRAYAALAARGEPGEAYNLCSGRSLSLRDALDALVRASGLDVAVEVDPDRVRPVDIPRLEGSNAKLRAATGWAPEIEIERTLGDLLAAEDSDGDGRT